MLRKSLSTLIMLLLVNLSLAPMVLGKNNTEKERKFVEKLKANVKFQGTGENSRIKLKLKGGSKLEGIISEINEDGIVVVEKKSGRTIPVSYPQIKQAKGNNWSTKQAIGTAIIIGIFVVLIVAVATAKD